MNWKIKFNETGKIPAFFNVFPEVNHNEMTGFSAKGGPASGGDASQFKEFAKYFSCIILKDSNDNSKIQKRMEVLEKLYQERGVDTQTIELKGNSQIEKIFSSLLLADWAAFYTALLYGNEPEQVPMVEEFKKLIS